jgi:DNA-binding IclR family transcriptional regulator
MPEVGIEIPAHASALGKEVLAFLPRTETGPLPSMTGETITSVEAIAEHLQAVASSGLAHERDEAVLGESCVAGAIFDRTGGVVGAVGVVFPTADWPAADNTIDAVRTTARTISRELGSTQWPTHPEPSPT